MCRARTAPAAVPARQRVARDLPRPCHRSPVPADCVQMDYECGNGNCGPSGVLAAITRPELLDGVTGGAVFCGDLACALLRTARSCCRLCRVPE